MRNGSGTPVGGERGDRQGEQGDRPHPPMGTSTPRRIENRKPQVDGPTGIIRNFFQSMFGGAPSEAQAQEGR